MKNIAFIDGQNLYRGILLAGWKIDYKKLRIYLKDKYKVEKAYYFIGFYISNEEKLYKKLQDSGYDLIFKKHSEDLKSNKKGNVDVEVYFYVLKEVIENKYLNKIILVSGDGDFKILVDYLIKIGKFEKILFPNKNFASSLYKKIRTNKYDYLENIKDFIEYK